MRVFRAMIVLCVSALLFAGCAPSANTSVTREGAATKVNATATPLPMHPRLGSAPETFARAYGDPTVPGDSAMYVVTRDPHIAGLTVEYVRHQATMISISAPQGSPWAFDTAKSICSLFAPHDGLFIKRVTDIDRIQNLPDGYDDVYRSVSLAKALPSQDFLGGSAGDFTIAYEFAIDNQPSTFDTCLVASGLWVPGSK